MIKNLTNGVLSIFCLVSIVLAQGGWTDDGTTVRLTTSTDKVGIGTTTVGSKLQVNGAAAIGYSASTAAPTNGFIVSGNVGIGTSSPNSYYKLHMPSGAAQIGPNWLTSAAYYQLGLCNTATTGNTDAILNINSGIGQAGVEFFRGGVQKWYLFNTPADYGAGTDNLCIYNNGYRLVIAQNGNVGIGTVNPGSYKLAVEGKIGAREIVVTTAVWADHVFKSDYNLKPLKEVEAFIKANNHLEGIPTQSQVAQNGVAVGEMQVKLLQKVEELTLYMIELKKENETLKTTIAEIARRQ